MKKLFLIILPFILKSGCSTNEPDNSIIWPLPAYKIDSINIAGRKVVTTTTYALSTPCWYYYRTEITNDNNVFTSKVFGKYDGEPCIQVLSSLKHMEQINFLTGGSKKLRFWQNDSTYIDTTIILK